MQKTFPPKNLNKRTIVKVRGFRFLFGLFPVIRVMIWIIISVMVIARVLVEVSISERAREILF